jgi:large subunit ribosomal protein L31e
MAKEKENKIVLEREYVVPLRRKCAHTPQYKRTNKAIKVLKIFLAKHMKVSDRDTDKIKIDRYLNEEIWQRGIRKPLSKVKVKCKKYEDGNVIVELAEIPAFVKFRMEKARKLDEKGKSDKKAEEKKPEETAEEKKEQEEKKEIAEEKQEAMVEAGMKQAEAQHKQMKHQVQTQHQIKKPLARKALQK